MSDVNDILDKIADLQRGLNQVRWGDDVGSVPDSHDNLSVEGANRRLAKLDELLRIAMYGTSRDVADAHDETLSIEGVNRKVDLLAADVAAIKAAVVPEPPA